MNYKKRLALKPLKKRDLGFEEFDENRLIQMAWQDRVPFEVIYLQYGISENQLKNKMRKLISKKAYNRWRKRIQGRTTKHLKKYDRKLTRFQ